MASALQRRHSLMGWMEKLLSDIDVSRSTPVAMFLELEAAARSSFDEEDPLVAVSSLSGMVPSFLSRANSDASLIAGSSFIASDHDESPEMTSELGTSRHGNNHVADTGMEASTSEPNLFASLETPIKYGIFDKKFIVQSLGKFSHPQLHSEGDSRVLGRERVTNNVTQVKSLHGDAAELLHDPKSFQRDGNVRRLSTESVASDLSSVKASETSKLQIGNLSANGSLDLPEDAEASIKLDYLDSDLQFQNKDLQFQSNLLLAVLLEEQNELQKLLNAMQRRLGTAKTDMEDLMARLTQEVAMKQFLTMKVKDLEVELETTRENGKANMQQAVLNERERFTQMQWDMEELRKQCFEMELKLLSEQEEKAHLESEKSIVSQEKTKLLKELDFAREQLENLNKHLEDLEVKSKAEVRVLVKEVKSLRSSQSEFKQELSCLIKEKLGLETTLQKEKMRVENANATNAKLLHECEILHDRLKECSVHFLVEEEDKLIVDTSSPSDAIDLLTTSDNRIGLLLAEAQLLAQDVQNSDTNRSIDVDNRVRKMLADTLLDNARLRKQMNLVLRCALSSSVKSDDDVEEEKTLLRKTVLSKFLER